MTNERIAQIKRLLEGISPAPWVDDSNDSGAYGVLDAQGNCICYIGDMETTSRADHRSGALIAAAPTVIAELLAEVERIPYLIQAEGDRVKGNCDDFVKEEQRKARADIANLARLTLPRCPICGEVMHADNTEFTTDGKFQHKCEEVE